MDKPHPNSIYSKIMAKHDKEEMDRFASWKRTNADDASSMERWKKDGFRPGQSERTTKNREDLDFE